MKKNTLIIISIVAAFLAGFFYKNDNDQNVVNPAAKHKISLNQDLREAFNKTVNYSAVAEVAELACFPSARFNCGQGGSCVQSTPSTYYLIDHGTEAGTYFRCDIKGCDQYPVRLRQSGEFTQFTPSQGQSMLFKVMSGGDLVNRGEFIDIATIGVEAVISTGKCQFLK